MPNWDTTFTVATSHDYETGVTGIGIVVQKGCGGKGRGPVVDEIAEGFTGLPAGDGQLFAVVRALEVAAERDFAQVTLRSEHNAMRYTLRHLYRDGRAGSGLQAHVLELARSFDRVEFRWVPRPKNHLARKLARQARASYRPVARESPVFPSARLPCDE